jgi:YHS domain-containing protein
MKNGLLTACVLAFVVAATRLDAQERQIPVESTSPAPNLPEKLSAEEEKAVEEEAGQPVPIVARSAQGALGKDVVSFTQMGEVVDGKAEFASPFDDQVFLFQTEASKSAFEADQTAFAPVFSGFSVVAYRDTGALVPGRFEFAERLDGRLFLLTDAAEQQKFKADPSAYAQADLCCGGYSPVSLVEEEVLRLGDKQHTVTFDGRRVLLANKAEVNAFLENPSRYYPVLGGQDVVARRRGRLEMGSPKISVLYKERLFQFADESHRDLFLANADRYSDVDVAGEGADVVAAAEGSSAEPTHYALGVVYLGQRYLFASLANLQKFVSQPGKYVAGGWTGPPAVPQSSTQAASPAAGSATIEVGEPAKPTAETKPDDDADPNVVEPPTREK